jgi:hypothetical protein
VALIHHRIQHFADSVAGAPVGISHSVYQVGATDVEAGAGTLSSLSAPAYDIEDDAVLFSVQTNTGNAYMVKYSAKDGVLWVTTAPNTSMPRQCRFTNHVLGVYRNCRIFKMDTRSGTVIYDQTGWTSSSTPRHFWDGQTGSLLMSASTSSRSGSAGRPWVWGRWSRRCARGAGSPARTSTSPS